MGSPAMAMERGGVSRLTDGQAEKRRQTILLGDLRTARRQALLDVQDLGVDDGGVGAYRRRVQQHGSTPGEEEGAAMHTYWGGTAQAENVAEAKGTAGRGVHAGRPRGVARMQYITYHDTSRAV